MPNGMTTLIVLLFILSVCSILKLNCMLSFLKSFVKLCTFISVDYRWIIWPVPSGWDSGICVEIIMQNSVYVIKPVM